eukprot:2176506-Pyramimonas_sp.AAC.1
MGGGPEIPRWGHAAVSSIDRGSINRHRRFDLSQDVRRRLIKLQTVASDASGGWPRGTSRDPSPSAASSVPAPEWGER